MSVTQLKGDLFFVLKNKSKKSSYHPNAAPVCIMPQTSRAPTHEIYSLDKAVFSHRRPAWDALMHAVPGSQYRVTVPYCRGLLIGS